MHNSPQPPVNPGITTEPLRARLTGTPMTRTLIILTITDGPS
jgi:hypothetical protein